MFDRDGLGDALAAVDAALDVLAAVELDAEDDRVALDATVEQQRLANRLAALQVRLLGHVDRREACRLDGAVTLASWYRTRTRLDHGEVTRRVNAARRLPGLPQLARSFLEGEVTAKHVTTVTDAAVPQRAAAIAACENALVELAGQAPARDVAVAVRRIRDHADPDGSDNPEALPHCGPDPRRSFDAHLTIDGLVDGRFLLDQIGGEALLTALDAAETPDPAGTPFGQRRCPGQRRADALVAVAHAALASDALPSVQGARPHLLVTVDLATLVGHDSKATRTPRLRFTGDLDPGRTRHLALHAAVTMVLTMGPWRVVNVGRRFRTLPPWLRAILEVVHRHCRGPDCDRPIAWTEAHHQEAWTAGAETDLNTTIPLCRAHHDLVTAGGWDARFDPDTGACTWTSTDGTTQTTHARAAA